jgi:allantoin racemase
MRLKVIEPIIGPWNWDQALEILKTCVNPDVKLELEKIEFGPSSIESDFDLAYAAPFILQKVEKAKEEKVDGIFIDCFGDPAVKAAREITDIPVVGAFQPAMAFASLLGQRIGIVTILSSLIPNLYRMAREHGFEQYLASIRSIELPVLEIEGNPQVAGLASQECLLGIKEEKADVFVLGCTGMAGLASEVQKQLRSQGYDVPVIDPAFAALQALQACVRMQLKQSKISFPYPPQKKRTFPFNPEYSEGPHP